MAKWTEIDTQVIEAGQEVPLDATKTAAKVVAYLFGLRSVCPNAILESEKEKPSQATVYEWTFKTEKVRA